jgi:glycosyltransferase involved in cell wall biosynthesis
MHNRLPDRIGASVIVCTYNRAASLLSTLECLASLEVSPEIDWEVLVVDNNSRDDTSSIVRDFQRRWARLRYVFEPQQGLSHARNRGIAEARGYILLFTDDDVCPDLDWLVRILDGMKRHGCDACGGYIAPAWEVAPPPWLTERFHGFLAVRTACTEDCPITDPRDAPFGANMAFRRDVFERIGAFDITRGRKGNVLAGGEDIEMFERLLRTGAKVMFFGSARVTHKIERFRLTKRYFRRWRFQNSRDIGEMRGAMGDTRLFGIPFYMFPQLLRAIGKAVYARVTRPSDEAFEREIIVWHFLGLMNGLARRRGCPGPAADTMGSTGT